MAMETLVEYRDAILIGATCVRVSYIYIYGAMKSSSDKPSVTLAEADIPGASIGNREPRSSRSMVTQR